MYNPQKIVNEINRRSKIYFQESTFQLNRVGYSEFVVSGDFLTKAINNYKNTQEEIKVLKWFDNYWIYVNLKFDIQDNVTKTFFSLSVFQGDQSDDVKTHLLRAEWDNFENNMIHPQPHWHIYSSDRFNRPYDQFKEMIKEGDGFQNTLDNAKSNEINLKRIHFAMNGDWSNKGGHIHTMNSESVVVNWFHGLLDHIKSQLEYIKQ